jgi:hypothetical protein
VVEATANTPRGAAALIYEEWNMTKAEQLIETICMHPNSTDDGSLANELLREFHRGFPVEHLRPLLLSENGKVVSTASFIVDELGSRARPLLKTMARLLSYPDRLVRADAIGSILTCATGENQSEIAAVISMLEDADWPIRWKTMEFLSLASLDQLRAALEHFARTKQGPNHVEGLRWLTSESARNPDELASWLRSNRTSQRRYGVVAAARMASTTTDLLVLASSIDDDDVKQFANSMLKMRIQAKGNRQH